MLQLLIAIGLMTPPGALVRLPEPAQLVAAVRSGDEVEIERVAARLGAVRLERLAETGKREERLAALRGLTLVSDGWAVLPRVAALLTDGDCDVAELAGVCARDIAEEMTPELREREEMPADVPLRAAAELLAQARKAALQPSLRVSAIAAVASLRAVTRIDELGLQQLLLDDEPQVRRAAAEALAGAGAGSVDQKLEHALAGDPAAEVAAAAAATLCRDVPPTPPSGKSPALGAERRAARLGPPARERLRALAVDESLSLADRLDLLPCLRVGMQGADQKVLDVLARRPPEALRRRARSLGGH